MTSNLRMNIAVQSEPVLRDDTRRTRVAPDVIPVIGEIIMRLWIISDRHIEQTVWRVPRPMPEFDVLIAAGDIHDPVGAGVRWLAEQTDKPIVYVIGNHEWYAHRERFTVAEETVRAKALAWELGVHLLMDEAVVIGGACFLGASLWTDYDPYGTSRASMNVAAATMNDHRVIFPEGDFKPLKPVRARQWHQASVAWLAEQLQPSTFDGPTVVATHHVPHPGSIAPQYTGDRLSPAFCSTWRGWSSDRTRRSGCMAIRIRVSTIGPARRGSSATPKGYGPLRPGGRHENSEFDPVKVVEM